MTANKRPIIGPVQPAKPEFVKPPKFEEKGHKLFKGHETDHLEATHTIQTGTPRPPGSVVPNKGGTVNVSIHKQHGAYFALVELHSYNRTGLISRRTVDFNGRNETDIAREINFTGGALAEYQSAQYGDPHSATEIAKLAEEAFREVMAEINHKH